MGLFSSIGNALKSAFTSISSVLQNSPLMQKLLPILAVVIPPPLDAVAVIALQVIGEALGTKENPDELGYQMQKADMRPEDFASFKEYKEYLDEHYPFDQEAFDNMSPEERTACRYVGTAGMLQELKEANGFEISPEALGKLATSTVFTAIANQLATPEQKGAADAAVAAGVSANSAEAIVATLEDN